MALAVPEHANPTESEKLRVSSRQLNTNKDCNTHRALLSDTLEDAGIARLCAHPCPRQTLTINPTVSCDNLFVIFSRKSPTRFILSLEFPLL
jgi:hypothetical protein